MIGAVLTLIGVTLLLLWLLNSWLGADTKAPEVYDRRRSDEADTVPPRLPTIEWAGRGTVWRSLDAENHLLADLLAGRIDQAEYRRQVFDLACRSERP